MDKYQWVTKKNWCIKYKLLDLKKTEKLCILAAFAGLEIEDIVRSDRTKAVWFGRECPYVGHSVDDRMIVCQPEPLNLGGEDDDILVTYTEVIKALKETISRQVHRQNKKKVIAR